MAPMICFESDAAPFIRSQLMGLRDRSLQGRRIVILGLTPLRHRDPRQSAAGLDLCRDLLGQGARLVILDRPQNLVVLTSLLAMSNQSGGIPGSCELESDVTCAFRNAAAVVLLPGFRHSRPLAWRALACSMQSPGWVFDLRPDGDLSRAAASGLQTWQLGRSTQR